MQFNDTHLSTDNPLSYANWHACIDYVQDNADYFVANGDIVDKLDSNLLGFVQDQLSIYDNCMTVMGNHEWYPNDPATEENYAAIQSYWKNDVYYSAKVLKDKVMLIQMDNSQEVFTADQRTSLTNDLETAEANGYAVLLFVHVPLGNNLTPGEGETEYPFYSVDDTSWASTKAKFSNRTMNIHSEDANTAAVCQLIADNADIIKGVFTGHLHSDYYTTIYSSADGTGATIPQYVNGAAKFDTGNVLKINLK